MHNNYIVGIEKKIYREKEMLLYEYDYEEYYSSKENRYLKLKLNKNILSSIDDDEYLIKIGISLAIITKRILILPKFNCSHCKSNKYYLINDFCSYIFLFNMRELDRYFKHKYRENV